jgi:hypothetical protein
VVSEVEYDTRGAGDMRSWPLKSALHHPPGLFRFAGSGAIAAEALVPSLASLLSGIPEEFKPITSLGIGAFILVCLALFHGAGLHHILRITRRGERRLLVGRPHLLRAGFVFGWSIFLMLWLHIAEILIWAFTLNNLGLIARVHDAIYFCANAYTTLGYGTVALEPQWRNISPIIAISGLFTFAWTTSTLVDVVRSHGVLIDQLEDERERQLQLRADARIAVRETITNEKEAERAEKLQAKKQDDGDSLAEQFRGWKRERREIEELRTTERADVEKILKKEHEDEDALGPGVPPPDSGGKKP